MKSTSKVLSVSEGMSLVYLIPGVLLIAVAIPFLFFFPFVGLVLIVTAIILFLTETGLEIDLEQMNYRRYKNTLGIKFGLIKHLPEINEFHLRLAVESKTLRGMIAPAGNWTNTTGKSKSITYDLSYINSMGEPVILYEFQDYDLAKKMLKQLYATEKFDVVDHIAIKLQENRAKRANRR